MRKFYYIFFIINLLTTNLYAQPGIGSARSLVKLEFKDIYGLQISQSEVTIALNSIEKFKFGAETNWLNSHLTVTGVKNFEIGVRSNQSNFFSNNIETDISVSNIEIQANLKSINNTIFLKNKTQVLIYESNGDFVNYINIKYGIPANKTGMFLNQANNTIETIILYTLIPL